MMTSLQIILAAVGIFFIVALVGYNLWQERKYRQEASRLFSTKREDILLGESVATENHGGFIAHPPGALDDGAGWRLDQAANRDTDLAAPVAQQLLHGRMAAEPRDEDRRLHIHLEGPLGEVDEDEELRVPTHAQTMASQTPRPAAAVPAVAVPKAADSAAPSTGAAVAMSFHIESGLDEAIEYVARLRFSQPSQSAYAPLLDGLRRIGKGIRAMGKRPEGGWEPVGGHARAYEALELGIQLADRGGALSQEQLDRFCTLLYDFAAAEGGAVSCPDKQAALQVGHDLDSFCMDVDVLIGLNVVSPDHQPFHGQDIHRHAVEAGLVLKRDGVYYLQDDAGRALFSLVNQAEQPFREDGGDLLTHGVTLLFDVPRVKDGLAVFDRMTTLGLRLADALHGRLVDDNGRPVNQESLQKDRRRLGDYYGRMQSRGIPAGEDRALRLFS